MHAVSTTQIADILHFNNKTSEMLLIQPDEEAVVRSCSAKKMFLKICQYSQENTCVEVSF